MALEESGRGGAGLIHSKYGTDCLRPGIEEPGINHGKLP